MDCAYLGADAWLLAMYDRFNNVNSPTTLVGLLSHPHFGSDRNISCRILPMEVS